MGKMEAEIACDFIFPPRSMCGYQGSGRLVGSLEVGRSRENREYRGMSRKEEQMGREEVMKDAANPTRSDSW